MFSFKSFVSLTFIGVLEAIGSVSPNSYIFCFTSSVLECSSSSKSPKMMPDGSFLPSSFFMMSFPSVVSLYRFDDILGILIVISRAGESVLQCKA